MADYDLSNLIDWTRRRAGDRLVRQREVLTTDGTNVILLNNEGNIVIRSCLVAGLDQVVGDDFEQDVNVLTFVATPPADTSAVVVYDNSVYTDDEVVGFIGDAARDVSGRLRLNITVGPSGILSDANNLYVATANTMREDIEGLIVIKAAIAIREDVTNGAASDAILIKDGDTTIDTSKTAQNNEKRLKAMQDEFDDAFAIAVANNTRGVAGDGLNSTGGSN